MPNEELVAAITGVNLNQEAITPVSRRQVKRLMYFRSCSDEYCNDHEGEGWITTGPALQPLTAMEHTEFIQIKHMVPLHEYGDVEIDEVRDPGTRFVPLLDRNGLKEMPVNQLQAYGWHHLPSIVAARPELDGIEDLWCEHGCPTKGSRGRWFPDLESYKQHIQAIHQDVAAPAAIGRHLQAAIEHTSSGGVTPDMVALITTATVNAIKSYESTKTTKDAIDVGEEPFTEIEEDE